MNINIELKDLDCSALFIKIEKDFIEIIGHENNKKENETVDYNKGSSD